MFLSLRRYGDNEAVTDLPPSFDQFRLLIVLVGALNLMILEQTSLFQMLALEI